MTETRTTGLVLCGFGLVFTLTGAWTLFLSATGERGVAGELRAAPVVDARSIGSHPAGTLVVVEGRIAADNPVVESGLVALLRQQAEGVRRTGENRVSIAWVTRETVGRPLLVETSAGPLRIVNSTYAWWEAARVMPADPGVVTPGGTRLAGFAVGDPITAQGRVVASSGGAALEAAEIYGGGRTAYLTGKQVSDWVGYILGGLFATVGLAVSAVGLRKLLASAPAAG